MHSSHSRISVLRLTFEDGYNEHALNFSINFETESFFFFFFFFFEKRQASGGAADCHNALDQFVDKVVLSIALIFLFGWQGLCSR
jgi:hypothetical protein